MPNMPHVKNTVEHGISYASVNPTKTTKSKDQSGFNFSWTLFTTIACKDSHDVGNILAYQSWQRLRPAPSIVYVSTCPPPFAKDATTITTFDRTASGLPLFSDLLAMTERVETDLVAWTNADILLAGDVATTINHFHMQQFKGSSYGGSGDAHFKSPHLWMAVAARWDLTSSTLTGEDSHIRELIEGNNLGSFLRMEGKLHTQGKK